MLIEGEASWTGNPLHVFVETGERVQFLEFMPVQLN